MAFLIFLYSVIHVEGRGSYLDDQDFQSCVTIILHMILQVVASCSRIKTARKGEGLGLAFNQTKDRENEVFWQNQNVDQLKKPFVMSIWRHLQLGKQIILHTSYLTSE